MGSFVCTRHSAYTHSAKQAVSKPCRNFNKDIVAKQCTERKQSGSELANIILEPFAVWVNRL